MLLPAMPVSSYLTFSPSLRQAGAVYSLWHFLLLYGCPPNTLIYHKADCSALPGLSSPHHHYEIVVHNKGEGRSAYALTSVVYPVLTICVEGIVHQAICNTIQLSWHMHKTNVRKSLCNVFCRFVNRP